MKQYMLSLAVLTVLAASSLSIGQGQTWIDLAPLNEPRQEVGVAELDGKIYVLGGFREDRTTADTAEVYDPQTDSWGTVNSMPIAVNHPAAVSAGGKLYVIGGYRGPGLQNPTDALQVYDPQDDKWTLRAPMPTARGGLAAAVFEGKLYAVGGARGSSVGDAASYNTKEDKWTPLEPLLTPRDHLGIGVVAGKLYAIGGRDGQSFILDAVEAYDPSTNRWEQLPPMPTGRSGHAVAVLGACLYAFGGEGNEQDPAGMFAEVEAFNTETGSWTSLAPMPTPRHGMGAVGLGDRIFLPGGATVAGFRATGVFEAFNALGCG